MRWRETWVGVRVGVRVRSGLGIRLGYGVRVKVRVRAVGQYLEGGEDDLKPL